jgi:hypothetical protein
MDNIITYITPANISSADSSISDIPNLSVETHINFVKSWLLE